MLVLLTGVFTPLPIFRFKAEPFALYLLLITTAYLIIKHGHLSFSNSLAFIGMSVCTFITTMSAVTGEMAASWKKTAMHGCVVFFLLAFVVFIGRKYFDRNILQFYIKGLKIGCMINLFWCLVQYVSYYKFGRNINDIVFRDMLGLLTEDTIYLTSSRLSICGLTWHPAQLAAIIAFSYCLWDRWIIKALIILVCIMSLNSTCLITAASCFGMDLISCLFKKGKYKKTQVLIVFIIVIAGAAFISIDNDFSAMFMERVSTTLQRIASILSNSTAFNQSTYLHARYYLYYPTLLWRQSLMASLFGYGINCSGYPYAVYLNQYSAVEQWGVESDLINILVGRGIIYALIYYGWLLVIAIKGLKLSKKYFIFIITLLVAGVFYDNQFVWVMIPECLMYFAIGRKINIWELDQGKAAQRTHKR